MTKIRNLTLSTFILFSLLFGQINTWADSNSGDVVQKTAHEIYMDLLESSVTFRAVELRPNSESAAVTFGAEKEGSSFLITRVMGPCLLYTSPSPRD